MHLKRLLPLTAAKMVAMVIKTPPIYNVLTMHPSFLGAHLRDLRHKMQQLELTGENVYAILLHQKINQSDCQKNGFHSSLKQCYYNEQPVYKETYTVKILPL